MKLEQNKLSLFEAENTAQSCDISLLPQDNLRAVSQRATGGFSFACGKHDVLVFISSPVDQSLNTYERWVCENRKIYVTMKNNVWKVAIK